MISYEIHKINVSDQVLKMISLIIMFKHTFKPFVCNLIQYLINKIFIEQKYEEIK